MAVQVLEFLSPRRRQKILSGLEHLAEFYEGRPKLLEGQPRALRRFEMSDLASFPPLEDLAGAFEQGSNPGAAHEISEPMAHEDRTDLTQTW